MPKVMFKQLCTIALISHASKVMLKILQARLQQYMRTVHENFQILQLGLQKADQRPNWQHQLNHRSKRIPKTIYFCFIDYAKAFDCVDHNKLENFSGDGNAKTTLSVSWENCTLVKKQLDMKQQTGSKLWKEYVKTVCCHPVYLTYMHSMWSR